tara:strand:- start:1704 stop:1883 length:180 start_codon:yes stop_codon:yes gene_type:complete
MNHNRPIITIKSNGPISINGDVILLDENGNEIEHKSRFSLCSCTKSNKMPFCDGSHKNQ